MCMSTCYLYMLCLWIYVYVCGRWIHLLSAQQWESKQLIITKQNKKITFL